LQPRISYIICSIERTGSYLLSDALGRTGIAGRPQEFFHPGYLAKLSNEADEGAYAEYFKQIFAASTTSNAIFGAKLHWSHMFDLLHTLRSLPDYSNRLTPDLLQSVFPNLHYIQITRRDKLRQAISFLKARQTDMWWEMDAWVRNNRKVSAQPPTFDVIALDRIIHQIEAHEAAWKEYFRECGVHPYEVVYEELIHSYEQYEHIIRQVLHYLTIPIPAALTIPEPRYKKQADETSEEWVKKYLQLKQAQQVQLQPEARQDVVGQPQAGGQSNLCSEHDTLDLRAGDLSSSSRALCKAIHANANQKVPEQQSSPAASALPVSLSLRPLNIVIYSTRPLGGAPLRLTHCIDTCTPHTARCVWPYRASNYSTDYRDSPAIADAQIATAEVVIVFDGKIAPQHRDLLSHKEPITFAYSNFGGNDTWSEKRGGDESTETTVLDVSWVRQGLPGAVLDQIATHPYFQIGMQDSEHEVTNRANVTDRTKTTIWTVVPDPLPYWEEAYKPAAKADVLTVCYISPSLFSGLGSPDTKRTGIATSASTNSSVQSHHRIILQALECLSSLYPLRVVVFGPTDSEIKYANSAVAPTAVSLAPSSFSERWALRRQAHIILEDCASGNYHHASLVGLSTGSVVVNGLGLQPQVVELFRACACGFATGDYSQDDGLMGNDKGLVDKVIPFVYADVASVESVLAGLIRRGMSRLEEEGRENRRWVEKHWNFTTQWERFWEPLIKRVVPPPVPGGKIVLSKSSAPSIITTSSQVLHAQSKSLATISVVVISHNEGENLHRTINSLQVGLPNNSEIIVVDDSSTDGSTERLNSMDGRITVLHPKSRLGVASARNFGARHTRGDIIVFSDAHVSVPNDWVAPLADALIRRDVGAVAPAISMMGRIGRKGYGGYVHAGELTWRWLGLQGRNPYQVPLLCGCFLAIRRDVLEATGGFDSGMIMYGLEDIEFSLRLWLLGYECLVVPALEVEHQFRIKDAGLPDYQSHWLPVLHNMLRLAVMHFRGDRIQQLVEQKVKNHAFPLALARVAASDAWQRRSEMQTIRRYDDDWFFSRFNTTGKPR
jgi:LPS sulfotransferase NodH/GT2 family glycosyltransferase